MISEHNKAENSNERTAAYMPQAKTAEWGTPQKLFDSLNEEFGFTIDVAASDTNHKCERYYTEADDGLSKSWRGETVYCNPPYGRPIKDWVRKASSSGAEKVVMLLPARTDTAWFHDYVYGKAGIRFIRGRLHYNDDKDAAPFPSMIVIFDGNNRGEYIENEERTDR